MSANDNFSLNDDEELSLHDDASLDGSAPASNKGDALQTNTNTTSKHPTARSSPTTQEEQFVMEKERKARTLLLMAVPKDHLRRFHGMDDAKEIWAAIKTRFGGNANSKKMQKAVLKQQFEAFTISSKESLEKGYDRFQKLLSQLDALGASVSDEDANHKFLRSLPPAMGQSWILNWRLLWTAKRLRKFYKMDRQKAKSGWKMHEEFDKRKVDIRRCKEDALKCKWVVLRCWPQATPAWTTRTNRNFKTGSDILLAYGELRYYLNSGVFLWHMTGNRAHLEIIKTLFERGNLLLLEEVEGCIVEKDTIRTLSLLGKFDGKSVVGCLVGYSVNSKAFRVYNLVTKRVEVNLHVNFLEEKPNVQGIGHRLRIFTNSYYSSTSRKQDYFNNIAKRRFYSPKHAKTTPNTNTYDDIMILDKELIALALMHLVKFYWQHEVISPSDDHEEKVFSDADDDEMPEIRIYDKSSEDGVDVSTNHTLRIHNAHPQMDFLQGSNLRYALTANPTIYDSLVKQFWQSAIAHTRADGSLEIIATIDTIRYTISEASIRDSLQLDDATGITMLPNVDLFEGMGQIGTRQCCSRSISTITNTTTNPNTYTSIYSITNTTTNPNTYTTHLISTPTPPPSSTPPPPPETELKQLSPKSHAFGMICLHNFKLIQELIAVNWISNKPRLNNGNEIVKLVRRTKRRKAPMLSEETPKKSKEQILQEEASLAEAIRLDSLQKEEEAKQIHLDALPRTRIAEKRSLTKLNEEKKAQAMLSKSMIGSEIQGDDCLQENGVLVNQKKEVNQGTWKINQLKKLSFAEVKEEFDKLVKQIESFAPISFEATKASLKRFGEELQTKTPKRLKEDKDDESKEDESTKKSGKRRKQMARKGMNTSVDENDSEDSDKVDEQEEVKKKGVYPVVREDGTDLVYIILVAMLNLSRDVLTELYKIVNGIDRGGWA
ncbi:hypothetical protein Tco_0387243 [Tanacetum coccineum]